MHTSMLPRQVLHVDLAISSLTRMRVSNTNVKRMEWWVSEVESESETERRR